jgi:hypothetical protein
LGINANPRAGLTLLGVIFTEPDPLGDFAGENHQHKPPLGKLPISKLLGRIFTTLLGKSFHDRAEGYSTSYLRNKLPTDLRWGYNDLPA